MTSYENSLKLNKRLLNSKKILEIFKQNKLILNLECLSLKNVTRRSFGKKSITGHSTCEKNFSRCSICGKNITGRSIHEKNVTGRSIRRKMSPDVQFMKKTLPV